MGIKQSQIIVNFSNRRHGGSRRAACGTLFDGDRRGKAFDMFHFGFLQTVEKLPGIGRKALHIPPLSLCVERIKRQRGFARAGKSGHDHQFVTGDRNVDIFQIVLCRTADTDIFKHDISQ